MYLLDLLRIAAALTQLLPLIKRLAVRTDARERLGAILLPLLEDVEKSMEGLHNNGRKLAEILKRIQMPLGRRDATELSLAWADTVDFAVKVVEQVNRLARETGKLVAFETFTERLKTADPAVYELVKLLDRGYKDGVLDVKEVPTFVKLYGPKGRQARKLKKAAGKAVDEATPLVNKAKAVRIGKRLPRDVQSRLLKSFRRLKTISRLVRKVDAETAERMNEVAPDWAQPLVSLGKKLDMM